MKDIALKRQTSLYNANPYISYQKRTNYSDSMVTNAIATTLSNEAQSNTAGQRLGKRQNSNKCIASRVTVTYLYALAQLKTTNVVIALCEVLVTLQANQTAVAATG